MLKYQAYELYHRIKPVLGPPPPEVAYEAERGRQFFDSIAESVAKADLMHLANQFVNLTKVAHTLPEAGLLCALRAVAAAFVLKADARLEEISNREFERWSKWKQSRSN